MSELFTPLRAEGHDESPRVPAHEIRRRGDVRRRRRVVTQVVASAAVVAVAITGTGLLVGGEPEGRSTPPATTPSDSASPSPQSAPLVTSIPPDFPLGAGMVPGEDRQGPAKELSVRGDITACPPDTALPNLRARDSLGVSESGIEVADSRQLVLFASAARATRYAESVVATFEECPRASFDGGDTSIRTTVQKTAPSLGEDAWTIERGYLDAQGTPILGQQVIELVRARNALLLSYRQGEGPGLTDPDAFAQQVRDGQADLAAVVHQVCLLTGASCLEPDHQELGPRGNGLVTLGMSVSAVEAAGAVVEGDDGDRCRPFRYGDSDTGFEGTLGPDGTVVVLRGGAGTVTREGIYLGSTAREARTTYEQAEEINLGLRVPLNGGSSYVVELDGDRVSGLSVETDDQTCVR